MITTRVSMLERFLIAGIVGLGCPLLTTVAAWWTVAALSLYTSLPLSEPEIARGVLGGMAAGLVLDLVFLRRWVDGAYEVPGIILVPLYLAGSAIACAAFMGMPFGTMALGTMGGVYSGRRAAISGASSCELDRLRRVTSLFTTVVTGAWSVPFAILSLREGMVQGIVTSLLGWLTVTITGAPGVVLMLAVCSGLALVQSVLTGIAFRFASGQ